MKWEEVCRRFPDTWVVVEALESEFDGEVRQIHELALVEIVEGGMSEAVSAVNRIQRRYRGRIFHTSSTLRDSCEVQVRYRYGHPAIERPEGPFSS